LILLACLPLLAACWGRAGASVRGTVTLDGAPLNEGTITFVPLADDQTRAAAWTMIQNGQYAIESSSGLGTGSFRVEIRALRTIGDKAGPSDPTLPVPAKEAVPPRYNSKSELVVKLEPGENVANFALQTK
jgi:hypothetical protein